MFEQFTNELQSAGIEPALDHLAQHFRDAQEYYRLFEVLKIRIRHRLGLPLVQPAGESSDDLPTEVRDRLETDLLGACQEVGTLLFQAGRPDEGWAYLQPVGNRELAKQLLIAVPVTEDNINAIIEVALEEGVFPKYGFEVMLEAHGVCDAITTVDMKIGHRELDRQSLSEIAGVLVEHFYRQLLEDVGEDVRQRGDASDIDVSLDPNSLGELLARHPWIVTETGHHIDATHLASVVRIARHTTDPLHYQMARDLTEYGLRLAPDFQYAGEPPFESIYRDHQLYFDALLNRRVDEAIAHFVAKTESCDSFDEAVVVENLVALLTRVDHRDEALDWSLKRLIGQTEPLGIAEPIFEIADSPDRKRRLAEFFQTKDDLFGYAVCQLQMNTQPSK